MTIREGGGGEVATDCASESLSYMALETRSVPPIERILYKLQGALQPTPLVNSGIDCRDT